MYMQAQLALGLVISLFLAAIGFIFSPDFPLHQECPYVLLTKLGVLAIFGLTEFYFYLAFRNRAKHFETWCEVIRTTRENLPEETQKILPTAEHPNKVAESNMQRLRMYTVFFIVAFIALGVFLFVFIN